MRELLTFVVVGLVGGSSYALMALGLVLVNNVSRVLNVAQGSFGTFAAFVTASLVFGHGWPWPVALAAGIAAGTVIGAATAWLLLGRGEGALPPLVGTVALLSVLTLVEARYLGGPREFSSPVRGVGVEVLGVVLTPTRLLVMVAAGATWLALWVGLDRSRVGLAIRAGADNRAGARAVGLDPRRLEIATWAVAGGLGALAGIFLGWTNQTITPGFLTVALPQAFAAAMLGGMASLPGAIIGGLSIGVAESVTRLYWGETPGSPELVVFLVLFGVLLFRPTGIIGRRTPMLATDASESLVALNPMVHWPRPPRVGWARLIRIAPGPTVLGLVLLPLSLAEPDAFKLAAIPVYGMLAISLQFLTATTGQLSLGHAGLFGLGAFTAAMAVSTWELPPLLGFAVGPLAAGGAAALLGLASLRIRGLYLAVLTLAFGLVLQAFVFPTTPFSRGGAGLIADRPTLGPFDLNDDRVFLSAALTGLVMVWLTASAIQRSPLGRALVASRENHTAASARGIDPVGLGVIGFTVSGVFAGLAGATYAFRQEIVVASSFPVALSLTLVIWVVLGGLGSRVGVVVVAAAFTLIDLYASASSEIITLMAGVLVVMTIGRWPLGVAGAVHNTLSRWFRRRERPPAPPPEGPAATPLASPAEPPRPLVVPLSDGTRVRPVVLAARDVSVSFGGIDVLRGVDIDVFPGEVLGIFGPNGAGKTTLFNVLGGFVTPRRGEVWLCGRRVGSDRPPARARGGLGRSFQQGGLWLTESARANLLMAQHLRTDTWSVPGMLALGPREQRLELRRAQAADEVLDVLALGHHADRPVRELPYGDRKVLELGCALMSRPRVLLLDEPAAGLSADQTDWLATAVAALRRDLDLAVVVIEHDVPLVRRMSDRVYVLDFGLVIANGLPAEVVRQSKVIEAYLGPGAATRAGR